MADIIAREIDAFNTSHSKWQYYDDYKGCTKAAASKMTCTISGTYADNLLVCLKDLSYQTIERVPVYTVAITISPSHGTTTNEVLVFCVTLVSGAAGSLIGTSTINLGANPAAGTFAVCTASNSTSTTTSLSKSSYLLYVNRSGPLECTSGTTYAIAVIKVLTTGGSSSIFGTYTSTARTTDTWKQVGTFTYKSSQKYYYISYT